MGRKKKFIDKKKAATFQLMARDSSDPCYDESVPGSERIFVRVDNNVSYNVDTFDEHYESGEDDDNDPNSIFADAPEDDDDGAEGETSHGMRIRQQRPAGRAALPDNVRKEILELGFPDDGYNYLIHLREIKNTGGGSAFFSNPKAKLEPLPNDVKAYDASRIPVPEVKAADPDEKSIYKVAARSVGVKIKKAVDPEVAALLDDSDLSRFGSDVEDLEEDFIVLANAPEDGEEFEVEEFEVDDLDMDRKVNLEEAKVSRNAANEFHFNGHQDTAVGHRAVIEDRNDLVEAGVDLPCEKERPRRLLDEQFDMLELQEYGSDSDDGYIVEEDDSRVERLKHALNDREMDEMELDGKYRAPGDILRNSEGPTSKEPLDAAADVIRRCVEYGEKYENETQEDVVIVEEESSDESEVWDCETVISTYSNLDNHPGKIGAPETARKKNLAQTVFGELSSTNQIITLRGKERLPVDFLPQRKAVTEKTKDVSRLKTEQPKKKTIGQETKEEKKERKSALKEERRESRRTKKEIKGLYKFEGQRAQKAVAISGPSSIHLT